MYPNWGSCSYRRWFSFHQRRTTLSLFKITLNCMIRGSFMQMDCMSIALVASKRHNSWTKKKDPWSHQHSVDQSRLLLLTATINTAYFFVHRSRFPLFKRISTSLPYFWCATNRLCDTACSNFPLPLFLTAWWSKFWSTSSNAVLCAKPQIHPFMSLPVSTWIGFFVKRVISTWTMSASFFSCFSKQSTERIQKSNFVYLKKRNQKERNGSRCCVFLKNSSTLRYRIGCWLQHPKPSCRHGRISTSLWSGMRSSYQSNAPVCGSGNTIGGHNLHPGRKWHCRNKANAMKLQDRMNVLVSVLLVGVNNADSCYSHACSTYANLLKTQHRHRGHGFVFFFLCVTHVNKIKRPSGNLHQHTLGHPSHQLRHTAVYAILPAFLIICPWPIGFAFFWWCICDKHWFFLQMTFVPSPSRGRSIQYCCDGNTDAPQAPSWERNHWAVWRVLECIWRDIWGQNNASLQGSTCVRLDAEYISTTACWCSRTWLPLGTHFESMRHTDVHHKGRGTLALSHRTNTDQTLARACDRCTTDTSTCHRDSKERNHCCCKTSKNHIEERTHKCYESNRLW